MLSKDEHTDEFVLRQTGDAVWYLDSSDSIDVSSLESYFNSKVWLQGVVGNRVDDDGNPGVASIVVTGFGILREKAYIVDCP